MRNRTFKRAVFITLAVAMLAGNILAGSGF